MIHHYREKLLNYQKKINTFFSEYPFISLERIILLIVALFLHVRLNNRFTTCFAIVAFLVLFLQQILVGLSFLLDLFSLIYAWGKNNYEDIKHLLSYLFFELAAFILIFVTSLIIGRAVLNLLNIDISILNSVSASFVVLLLIFVLIALFSFFILAFFIQKIYFIANFNELGFKLIDSFLKFIESVIVVCILGLNSVAYEFIEIHQDFFVPYLKHYGIDEIAVTAKAIYSLVIYGILFAVTAFHIAERYAYSNIRSRRSSKDDTTIL